MLSLLGKSMAHIHISDWKDFDFVLEALDSDEEDFTDFGCSDENDVLYYGKVHARQADITVPQAVAALTPIADAEIFARLPPAASPDALHLHHDTTSGAHGAALYIKRPRLGNYSVLKEHHVSHLMGEELLEEAHTLEFLSRHPHPNIIKYHGVRSREGYLTGLVLDRHARTVEQYIEQRAGPINVDTFMDKLQSAVRHLHDLGWAHNDLNPSNILIKDAKESGVVAPVVIDFGSARSIGERLGTSRATHGWYDGLIENYTTSRAEHDTFALGKIRAWLEKSAVNTVG